MVNTIARIRLGCWLFNYSVDHALDAILKAGVSSGIKKVTITEYHIEGVFNNGQTFNMWNANKYYAWISSGRCGPVSFKESRPKAATMLAFRNAVTKYLTTPHQ